MTNLHLNRQGDEKMVFYWESTRVSLGTGTVSEAYNQIATNPTQGFPSVGWTGIEASTDVHAWNGNLIVVAVLFPISGSEYWLVVSSAGDGTEADAKSNLNIAINLIKIILNDYF